MKKIILILLISTLLVTHAFAEVKKADLAGSWYPGSSKMLDNQLRSYLEKATPPSIDGKIIAVIAPHAGYLYSGPVAAYSFKAVSTQEIETVIVVGFSHRKAYYDGIAVLDSDGFKTPLGVVKIDKGITEELIARHSKIFNYPIAFSEENSVEMEIPFIQTVLKDPKIVLVAIGRQSFQNCKILGEALYEVLKDKEKCLLVASTDMSHYLPYEKANEVDRDTVSLIKEFDPDRLYKQSLAGKHSLMCGYGAVCATMITSKMLGADKIEILKYANSGDVVGDKSYVVGYLSAAMYKSETNPKSEIRNSKKGEAGMLNEKQRKRLLQIARETMETYIKTGERLEFKEDDPTLNREMGAFVTLHRHGQLRGCIGNIIGKGPLYLTVRDMAVESSTGDPRFPPVTVSELKDIDIEISVLSELEKIDDPNIIEMGKHGVLVKSDFRSGVFLPQVATETGWSRDEFMSNLCSHKAGLPPDAWKKGECEIYIYTAEVFSEK